MSRTNGLSPTKAETRTATKLDRLVKVLLQEETVAQERLAEILGPRPQSPAIEELINEGMESTADSA